MLVHFVCINDEPSDKTRGLRLFRHRPFVPVTSDEATTIGQPGDPSHPLESELVKIHPAIQMNVQQVTQIRIQVLQTKNHQQNHQMNALQMIQTKVHRMNQQLIGDGYAFSQEEHGRVTQTDIVRAYHSTEAKPTGD
ncbi:hypothetical protein ACTXT7_013431 [Hymenolepis weldensis]